MIVSVSGVTKSYAAPDGRTLAVLRDLSLSAARGEMIAIVGASGVGKSTLLHVLGGLDEFEAGEIAIGGKTLHSMREAERVEFRNRHIGFVFQFHHLLPEFTALENVEMPMRIARAAAGERRARASALLGRVGLSER
ncbi:MAG: ATP-binding cassette domain-containing protein, partial [Acidobacteriota bacterium]|nr:ATP-binding cassette domain-containing protein [Acidobacteriota bacterium]